MAPYSKWVLMALLVATANGISRPKQTAGEELRENGCRLSTLRREFLVKNCSFVPCARDMGSDDVVLGSRCSVACATDGRSSHRQCGEGGLWEGPRLNCHRQSLDARRTDMNIKQVEKRGLFSGIKRFFTGAACAVFDDVLGMTDCDGGGGGGGSRRDTTPPSITCYEPLNTPIIADAGKCDAVVRWHDASATDDRRVKSVLKTRPTDAESGNRFKFGRHFVVYVATDTSGLTRSCSFTFKVEVVRCDPPPHPKNGNFHCNMNTACQMGYIYGTSCTATCTDGYTLTGSKTTTCQRNRKWTGGHVECSRNTCPQLTPPVNADIQCSDTWLYRSTCITVCKEGYRLLRSGTRSVTCGVDQTWSGILSRCEDNTPPEFKTCPSVPNVNAERGQTSAAVTWDVPVVHDNVDTSITPKRTSGLAPGSMFLQGTHHIEYTARDAANNIAIPCKFSFTVGKTTCPPIIVRSRKMSLSCPLGYAYGATCTFECVKGYDMLGKNHTTCERNDSSSLSGYWTNASPTCDVKTCEDKKLHLPKNGALACAKWIHGSHCRMYCNDKYDVPRGVKPYDYYVCDDSKGTWAPNDIVPDCTVKYDARKSRRMSEIRYFSGDCSSKETQLSIKQKFITALNTSRYRLACVAHKDCGIDNVEVKCGVVTRRKRDLFRTMALHQADRIKRDKTHELTITFALFTKVPRVDDPVEKWKQIESTLDSLKESLNQSIASRELDLAVGDFPMQMNRGSFQMLDQEAQLQCPRGSVPREDSFTCVVCPTRTYYDSSSDSCVDCPVGSYNDKENQTTCTQCPDGTSTLTKGSRDMDSCIAMCPAGSYSDTGLHPCAPCAVGTYQPQRNMKTCPPCPYATVTTEAGSITELDCQAFQLDTATSGGTVLASDIVAAHTNSWSVTFWLKVTSDNTNIIALKNNDVIFQIKRPSALSYDIMGITGSTGVNLVAKTWSHISAVWNGGMCMFHLYRDGTKIATKDMSDRCSVALTSATTLILGSATSGDSFSGSVTMLSVWKKALDDAAVRDLSNSCLYDDTRAAFRWQMVVNANMATMVVTVATTCDVNDNCAPDPCHGYKCEDELNDFVCHCKGGFTGKRCEIPPDYCANNLCLNGASCLPGRANYSCRCASGFRGTLCDDDIVNGAYGPWGAWSSCTKTCDGGVHSRRRECNDPVPDPDGQLCVGSSSETRDCNVDKCPACSRFTALPGVKKKTVNCSQKNNGNIDCHVTCKPGTEPSRILANPYFCGPDTNYVWSHMLNQPDARLPSCTSSAVPKQVALRVQVAYNVTTPEQLNPAKSKLTDLSDQNPCVQSGVCKVTTAIADAMSTTAQPVVRPTASGPSGGHIVVLVVVGTVQREAHVSATGDAAVASWNDITRNLEKLASLIQRAKQDGSICFNLAGLVYCPIHGSLLLQGIQICPPPRVLSFDGSRCVNCPAGSYYMQMKCVPCAKGRYQDKEGQIGCKPCPANEPTAVPGAASIDDCRAASTTTRITSPITTTTTATTTVANAAMTTTKARMVSSTEAETARMTTTTTKTTTTNITMSPNVADTAKITTQSAVGPASGGQTEVIVGATLGSVILILIIVVAVIVVLRRLQQRPGSGRSSDGTINGSGVTGVQSNASIPFTGHKAAMAGCAEITLPTT